MTIKFATVLPADDTLSVRFSYEPHKCDLRILLLQLWLPMMIVFCVVVSAFFWFKTLVPAEAVGTGITFLCATVLYRIIRSSFFVAVNTFDWSCDAVKRNGILISRLSEAEIALQSRLGWQGNRRFRLILKRHEKPNIILTETPLLEDQFSVHSYYGQTHTENIQTMFDGWVADTGRRDAVDERDANIFALAETLREFVGSKSVVRASPQIPTSTSIS